MGAQLGHHSNEANVFITMSCTHTLLLTEVHFLKEGALLYGLFHLSVSETDDELVRPLYNDLWSKMINVRKEDWRLCRQRTTTFKSGKTGETTLMLRDELKPFAASKRLSNNYLGKFTCLPLFFLLYYTGGYYSCSQ